MPQVRGGNPKYFDLKRKLRYQQTPAEQKLWHGLRSRRFEELRFKRPHGIGGYIVDFYCAKKKVVIEVNGNVHDLPEQTEHGEKRDCYLRRLRLRVLRYTNCEVLGNFDGVLQDLYEKLVGDEVETPQKERR